jgi:7-carboxy-7-deazaguanine synthase
VQGEGRWAGTRSVFVRTSGCNLRCWYCDTPYTSWEPEGTNLSLFEVVSQVAAIEVEHVVLTGGEPLLHPEIVTLSRALREMGRVITIETAGTIDRRVDADLMSISPKRRNSDPAIESGWRTKHQSQQHAPLVINRWLRDYDCQFKFVIDSPADLDDVEQYRAEFPQLPGDAIWLMPQGVDEATLEAKRPWLEAAAAKRGYHFCPRLHIALYGHQRGT